MKNFKHLEFIFTSSLLIILITLVFTYLFSAIFIHTGLSLVKIFSTYLLQFIVLIISTNYILKKFAKDYFNCLKINELMPMQSVIFSLLFSSTLIILLFSFDYLFSWVIDFKLSHNFGKYMDEMLKPVDGYTPEDESFTLVPITIQNVFLNIIGVFIIVFVSKSKYKTNK